MPYVDLEKKREYQRVWIAARRTEYLKDKKCVECGSTEGLQIDHIDPEKKKTHRIWSYCKKKRDAELKKCQILCSDCHYKKTAEDIRTMRAKVHGTMKGYTKYHCRCKKCMPFMKDSPDEYSAGIDVSLLTV